MDEDTHVIENQDEQEPEENKKANPLLLGGVVLAILLLFGGVVLSQRSKQTGAPENQDVLSENQEMVVQETNEVPQEEMIVEESESDFIQPEGSEGTEEVAGEESDAKVVEVEGGSFYFKPNTLTVNEGEAVKIVFSNVDGMHDFVVDELDIKTPVIKAGETTEVEFTANEPGTYEFYCSVGSHRQMGMKGTLIVR